MIPLASWCTYLGKIHASLASSTIMRCQWMPPGDATWSCGVPHTPFLTLVNQSSWFLVMSLKSTVYMLWLTLCSCIIKEGTNMASPKKCIATMLANDNTFSFVARGCRWMAALSDSVVLSVHNNTHMSVWENVCGEQGAHWEQLTAVVCTIFSCLWVLSEPLDMLLLHFLHFFAYFLFYSKRKSSIWSSIAQKQRLRA